MRILFFGSGAFGVPTLEHLHRAPSTAQSGHHRFEIVGVVSQPDRPAGRGSTLTPTPVSAWTAQHAPTIPLLRPDNINDPASIDRVRALDADAWVVIAYGQKLSNALLADRFAVNLHASLLPRWRGAAPINAAILAGDKVTGNSVITLADRMDAGLILGRSVRPIEPDETAGELHDLLATDGPGLVESVLVAHQSGTLAPQAQDESAVTLAGKLGRADAWLDFAEPAEAVRRRIHGLTPWPGVSVRVGPVEVRVLRAEVGPSVSESTEVGSIVDAGSGVIRCAGDTSLRVLEVQPPGKRPMAWSAFANGRRIEPGTIVSSIRQRP